jgi:crossover junction endodeoxyribonuclease RuvC
MKNKVLAIDPGYDRVGIAIMERSALAHSECFSPGKGVLSERLREIGAHLRELIAKHAPDAVALETIFFSKNQKTAIAVAEARGAIMLVAAEEGIPLFEYSPQEVKIAVTGSGNAGKAGVIKMVSKIIALPPGKRHDDEYDAIALAFAHQSRSRFPR